MGEFIHRNRLFTRQDYALLIEDCMRYNLKLWYFQQSGVFESLFDLWKMKYLFLKTKWLIYIRTPARGGSRIATSRCWLYFLTKLWITFSIFSAINSMLLISKEIYRIFWHRINKFLLFNAALRLASSTASLTISIPTTSFTF